jgi:hypothetical protein
VGEFTRLTSGLFYSVIYVFQSKNTWDIINNFNYEIVTVFRHIMGSK